VACLTIVQLAAVVFVQIFYFFFFQAEDGIRDFHVTGVQTCALPISEQLLDKMAEQLAIYPQEKIHLHVDRSIYTPGDTIWFKAYPVHATFHTPRYQSRYIYAELWNPQDSLLARVRIRVDSVGIYSGYLAVPDDVAEGRYGLRTYSRYMLSQGERYLSRRTIDIKTAAWKELE